MLQRLAISAGTGYPHDLCGASRTRAHARTCELTREVDINVHVIHALALVGLAVTTLTEVEFNVRAGRPIILIEGSGRAADALVSLVRKTPVSDPEIVSLRERAGKAGLARRPELFTIVTLQGGAPGLRDAISAAIQGK